MHNQSLVNTTHTSVGQPCARFVLLDVIVALLIVVLGGRAEAASIAFDPSYGTNGAVITVPPDPAVESARPTMLGNGGLIYRSSKFTGGPMEMQRVSANGLLTGVPLSWPGIIYSPGLPMRLLADGRLLLGAMKKNVVRDGGMYNDAAILRLDSNGDLDPSFGEGGITTLPAAMNQPRGGSDIVGAIAIDEQGRIIVAVTIHSYIWFEPEIIVIRRLDSDGRLDPDYSIYIDASQAGYPSYGENIRVTPLYGGALRVDAGRTHYYDVGGRQLTEPSSSPGGYICDVKGWALAASLADGNRMYSGIPSGSAGRRTRASTWRACIPTGHSIRAMALHAGWSVSSWMPLS